MNLRKIIVFIMASLALPWSVVAASDPEPILVCYPGGAVSANDANTAMNSMLRVVERVGEWPENTFNSLFTTRLNECRKLMAEKKPRFAITSLGLYLEFRSVHHLIPVVQPQIKGSHHESYRVVVQKDKFKNLDELKGKTLGGTVLAEEAFIGRIVFAGKYDPATFFSLKSSNQAIRALRALDKGEMDAVILNEQQFGALASLHLQTPIEPVFVSAEIPLIGMVADDTTTTEEDRTRIAKALNGMCSDTEGRKLCEIFGVESFVVVDPAVFEPFIKLWDEGK